MKIIRGMVAALIIGSTLIARAQTQAQALSAQTEVPDSVVRIVAEAKKLLLVPPEQLPLHGTYWLVTGYGSFLVPYPGLPYEAASSPVFSLGSPGLFLVDSTGGVAPQPTKRQALRGVTSATLLERQGNAILDLIEQVQEAQFEADVKAMFPEMFLLEEEEEGGANAPSFLTFPDPGLWIFLPTNALTVPTQLAVILTNTIPDEPYDVLTKTALNESTWTIEVAGIYATTNFIPVTLSRNGRTNLFVWARYAGDSTGSGMPDWWLLKYFGTTDVDPYGDADNDGWNNLQEYQNGTNPTQYNMPPPPRILSAVLDGTHTNIVLTWQSGGGAVSNYTVFVRGSQVAQSANNIFTITIAVPADPDGSAHSYFYGDRSSDPKVFVRANFDDGFHEDSLETDLSVPALNLNFQIVRGPLGHPYLAATCLPLDLSLIRLTWYTNNQITGGFDFQPPVDLPASNLVNGVIPIPLNAWNTYVAEASASFYVKTLTTNGGFSKYLRLSVETAQEALVVTGPDFDFVDAQAHLKENLKFLLRAATVSNSFSYYSDVPLTSSDFFDRPAGQASYEYYGFHFFNTDFSVLAMEEARAVEENYLWRNFLFDSSELSVDGFPTTGAGYDSAYSAHTLSGNPVHKFSGVAGNNPAAPLGFTNLSTTWWYGRRITNGTDWADLGLYVDVNTNLHLATGAWNLYGLPINSIRFKSGSGSGQIITLTPGGSAAAPSDYDSLPPFYMNADMPRLQTVGYFFASQTPYYNYQYGWYPFNPKPVMPGYAGFSPTNTSPVLIAPFGQLFTVAGWAKQQITNGYSGKYAYLGQYFDKAYTIGTNGAVTTNSTGLLSPYGEFFPTMPGPAALVTMPDIDTGQRGTGVVQVIKLQLDVNHDGVMDLLFGGPDNSSPAKPMNFWVNDDWDRGHTVDSSDFEQDDFGIKDIVNLPEYQRVPDCEYVTISGQPAIPSTRDLEDYFRLWIPGLAAAMTAAPSNYTAQLTLTGDGQIRIFRAYEPNGGTNYLFDKTTASNQVANSTSLYLGLLTSSSPLILNNRTNEYFIFSGTKSGSAQIDLQIFAGTNLVADTASYLQINDIKQMYERWTVGELPNFNPKSIAVSAVDKVETPFVYKTTTNPNTPYVLFVHGWNMETWEKDRYAEVSFKRLYWQGYQGRFGSFRWPTGYRFDGSFSDVATDSRNYDNSEYTAWQSATGLTELLTDLNAEYPDQVYLMAHSMGNVVAGEALRLAGTNQIVNTYVAMQGAVPAHAYDPNATARLLGIGGIQDSGTPNRYANYWTNGAPAYFNGSAGAGVYVNLYNTNDYALDKWTINQNFKPDHGIAAYPGYHYSSSSGFYQIYGAGANDIRYLNFPTNTYEIFAYADEARCFAVGAQANVGGVFGGNEVNLRSVWPSDSHPGQDYSAHVWHSAEFRSDYPSRSLFWKTILSDVGFNLNN